MPLTFNLRHLDKKSLQLEGTLSADELELNDVDELVQVPEPLHYALTLERLNEDILVRGELDCELACQCVRCLRSFAVKLDLDDWTLDLPLEGEEKVIMNNDVVDLTP